jgi:hypothetical protein
MQFTGLPANRRLYPTNPYLLTLFPQLLSWRSSALPHA